MTNEEKAKEIAKNNAIIYDAEEDIANGLIYPTIHSENECEKSALEMAEWKDQQFNKYLKKKLNEVEQCEKCSIGLFPNDVIRYNGAIEVINEIINEFFK